MTRILATLAAALALTITLATPAVANGDHNYCETKPWKCVTTTTQTVETTTTEAATTTLPNETTSSSPGTVTSIPSETTTSVQDSEPSTSIVTSTTTDDEGTTTTALESCDDDSGSDSDCERGGTLPETGSTPLPMVVFGCALVAIGIAAARGARARAS